MGLPWARKGSKASQPVNSLADDATREGDRPAKKWWKANSHQRLEDGDTEVQEKHTAPVTQPRVAVVKPVSKKGQLQTARTTPEGQRRQGTTTTTPTATPLSPILSRVSSLGSEDEQYLQAQISIPPTRRGSPSPAQKQTQHNAVVVPVPSKSQAPQAGPSSGVQRPELTQQQLDELAGDFAPARSARAYEVQRGPAAEMQKREDSMWLEVERVEWLRRTELREEIEAGQDKKRRKWGLGPIKREKGIQGSWR